MDNRPIGIFDSGVGGLTVVKQVMARLPKEKIVYFGDTARVPYGGKSKETVTRFSREDIRFLLSKDVKAIIIACNTVSSNSLDVLCTEFDVPLFGVVTPGVSAALSETKTKRIGVIGTAATIRSDAYQSLLKKGDPEVSVLARACPLFVPLAEEGWTDHEVSFLTARSYLEEFKSEKVDTLILGCTHYPLLTNCIRRVMGEGVALIDPAYLTAKSVVDYLTAEDALASREAAPDPDFYVSDFTDKFALICEKALGRRYLAAEINIELFKSNL